MASLARACRLSVQAARRQTLHYGSVRGLRTSVPTMAAQNFTMPALSPTMTEGNITSWKVKEGDSFSAGDVILEVETDKAQMDVEAQDDGVMAKIMQGDGSKNVKVGSRIAVLAEPGDDLSSLEIPPEEPSAQPSEASTSESRQTQSTKPTPSVEEKKPAPNPQPTSLARAQKQKYPLYPSVLHILRENGLTKEDADKIPASGPNGRLLKGDVLAYLGRIEKNYSAEQSKRIEKLGHLDLSNIKLAQPKKEAAPAPIAKPEAPIVEPPTEVTLPISLEAAVAVQRRIYNALGVDLPLSTFIARAADIANDDLPRSRSAKPTQTELFNAVLGLDKVAGSKPSRGHYVPQITALPATPVPSRASGARKAEMDVLDILAGKRKPAKKVSALPATAASANPLVNVFSLTVPKEDERRAKIFLERVKFALEAEPGTLVM